MKRFLITTALEETWRDDEPVLFLGEWCRRYSRKERWSKMDAEVLPYHWDDRAKLYADYKYLLGFYERLLGDLAAQLNHIHSVDHGLRYWRMLVGPWLGYFSQILFDRWASIQQAVGTYELSGTCVLTGREDASVPNDMAHFARLFVGDDWNYNICAAILQQSYTVPRATKIWETEAVAPRQLPAANRGRQLKQSLAAWRGWTASALVRDQDAFFLSTYLPLFDELRLQWRLGQMPQLWRSATPVQVAIDLNQRQWAVSGDSRSEFEVCARALIPQQIPTAYLEGYGQLVEQAEGFSWPKRPKVILTSNSYISDDVFKVWAAEKIERGFPLVIGQHGGHDGVGRWSFVEDHGIAVSDRYLSWGWAEPDQPKITPLGQLKAKRPLGVRHAAQPGALLVAAVHPRYSYFMYSTPVASQWIDYFTDQFSFVEHLPQSIRDALTVRLYSQDWGWDQAYRWQDRFPELRLDDGRSDINLLIRQSRLYISTYNATTFLESFTMNIPTVIYWNPNHWELRDSAVPCFEELRRVGIFHETPESAAHHVAAIWGDVGAWWSNSDVQAVLERFKTSYCRSPDDLVDTLDGVLREVAASSAKTGASR